MSTLLQVLIGGNSFKGFYLLALFADEFIGYSDKLLLAIFFHIFYHRKKLFPIFVLSFPSDLWLSPKLTLRD
jgi:hypothetical protein